jgi:AAA15 family ATPase/GTPase
MKIIRISISNFRGLENILFEPDKDVNVIVGPNAIGKTTILEAIRLTKAVLAPRYAMETQQTLITLGALPQNFQFFGTRQLDFAALAGDVQKDTRIALEVIISEDEVEALNQPLPSRCRH